MNYQKNEDLKILFIGTPLISAEILKFLIAENFTISAVVTQIDKEVGRKKQVEFSPVKKVAIENNIPCFQPLKIRFDYEFAKKIDFDLLLCFSYGQIIPDGLLKMSKIKPLNIHPSLLPKYRGPSPIQTCILNGDKKTGISLMEMIDKMDAGDIYYQEEIDIDKDDNFTKLENKIIQKTKTILAHNLLNYANNKLPKTIQDESKVSFCFKIKNEDEYLDINLPIEKAYNHLKAFNSDNGMYLYLDNLKFKIYDCEIYSLAKIHPLGYLFKENKNLLLQFNDGILKLKTVQFEGKKKLNSSDFINGFRFVHEIYLK